MQIIIKRLDGEKKPADVEDTTTIDSLKTTLSEKMGIDKAQLKLIFKGAPLLDDKTIVEQNVKAGDVIHVILQLAGG